MDRHPIAGTLSGQILSATLMSPGLSGSMRRAGFWLEEQ
jgi:hypothetical protein